MGAYSRRALICYFGREDGRLFGGGRLLERGRLLEEIRYISLICHTADFDNCVFCQKKFQCLVSTNFTVPAQKVILEPTKVILVCT